MYHPLIAKPQSRGPEPHSPQQVRRKRPGHGQTRSLPSVGSAMSAAPWEFGTKRTSEHPVLVMGARNDPLEREADRCAELVMKEQLPDISAVQRSGQIQRQCSSCEEDTEAEELLAKSDSSSTSPVGADAPDAIHQLLRTPGRPLDESSRDFFQPRFGRDLSHVRIHADGIANWAARSVAARAFALDGHIAFADGAYAPTTPSGRTLLAHELTHVVRQSQGRHIVRRSALDDAKGFVDDTAESVAKASLGMLANAPAGPSSGFTGGPSCGANFCQPFTSKAYARANLAWAGPLMLAGIAMKVSPRVVPLWARYIAGGTAPMDLTSSFGKDFTASPTTADTTRFLVGELRKDVEANQASLMGSASAVTIDFTSRLTTALAAIDDPNQAIPPQMNFNIPSDIAGNVAGGIGKDETSFRIGAQPSPFNDSREATVKAKLIRRADGSVEVTPIIAYTVKDTIDLCPGDCGTGKEQVATIPLSRFEATGVSGDVPMTIRFPAPAAELNPFVVAAPAPAPPTPAAVPIIGKVTASQLNIRASASTSAAVIGQYSKGNVITLLCQIKGTPVGGVSIWYQTNKGFVSGYYVKLNAASPPPTC
jgi:hypothetical protein